MIWEANTWTLVFTIFGILSFASLLGFGLLYFMNLSLGNIQKKSNLKIIN